MFQSICQQTCPVIEFYLIDRLTRTWESLNAFRGFDGRSRRLHLEKNKNIYRQVFGGRYYRYENKS